MHPRRVHILNLFIAIMDFAEGKIIAEHYKLVKQLGRGSFGNVWLAHNLLADIDVAIKFYGTLDQNGLEEFRQEFKIAYKLRHPNLLNISHFDVYENCPYLVMPYCANGSVTNMIGKMDETEIWKFVADVSNGLAFLHTYRPPIIHQDIKPDNILMTSDGRYVITDFGISHSFRTKLSKTSNMEHSSGTLAYMGPERFSKKPIIVLASDIWALGATLYELMENTLLWEGMGGCAQLNGAALPDIEGNYSPALIRLVQACLAANTWERPTAEAIHAYATAYIQHDPLPQLCPEPDDPAEELEADTTSSSTQRYVQPSNGNSSGNEPTGHLYSPSHNTDYNPPYINQNRSYTPESKYHQDSSKTDFWKRWAMIAAACVCAIAFLTGIILFISHIKVEQQFISCKTPQDFEQFIKDHPKSSYAEKARKKLAESSPASVESPGTNTPQATLVAPVRQQTATTGTDKRTSKTTREYVQPNQNNRRSTAATRYQPTQNTAVSAARRKDDQAYYSCVTLEDYNSYLNNFPNGAHRRDAQSALNMLAKQRQQSGQQQQYGSVINETPPVEHDYHVRRQPGTGPSPMSGSSSRNINIGVNFNTSGPRSPRGPMSPSMRGGGGQRGGHTGRNER